MAERDGWSPSDWTPSTWAPSDSTPGDIASLAALRAHRDVEPRADRVIPPSDAVPLPIPAEKTPLSPQQRQPWYVVLLPSLAFASVQLAWGVQIGRVSPHLREMGLSDRLIGLSWLAGPLSGIIVQPIVGVFSDRCRSSLGRRRPFMIVGTLLVVASLLLFAFSGDLATAFGDPISPNGAGSKTGLVIALLAFWILDFCINMLQSPTRALIADIVPPEQVAQGNSYFAFANGFGKTVAYVIGALAEDVRTVYGVAAIFMLVFALIPSLLIRSDRPAAPEHEDPNRPRRGFFGTVGRTFSEVGVALRSMPSEFKPVFVVQFFLFVSFMLTFIYVSIYFGQLNKGNANAPLSSPERLRFQEGVLLANKALVIMSVLSMVIAPFVPLLARKIGTRLYWGGSNLIVGIALICLIFEPSKPVAVAIVASVGLSLSNAMSIPWSITALALTDGLENQRGLFFAVFNLAQAVPGLFSSFLGSLVVHVTNGNLTAPLVLAGIASVLAGVVTTCVRVPGELGASYAEERQDLTENDRSDASEAVAKDVSHTTVSP